MTYYLNKLQRLDEDEHYCVTLNRTAEIDPDKVIRRFSYRHPLVTLESMRALPELPRLNGPRLDGVRGGMAGVLLSRGRAALRSRCRRDDRGAPMRSSLYTGTVMHARKTPTENVFRYRVCFYLLIDQLPELDRRVRLFGWNRRSVVSLHDRDHLDVHAYLAANGIEVDRILLLTNLRVLGYVFNPVSFFYCYSGGELACIVAEVSNTFGERLPYLLSSENRDTARSGASPTGTTRSCTSRPSSAWTRATSGGSPSRASSSMSGSISARAKPWPFFATLTGTRRPLTSGTLARSLLRFPLMPVQVVGLIHLQAMRLWLKRVPFFSKPPFVPGEGSVRR